jgi:cold shock protein
MPIGRISHYDGDRGFGFIAPSDGSADIFVHVSHIENADVLEKDQSVSFEFATDARTGKPRADKVRVIDASGVLHGTSYSDGSFYSDGSGYAKPKSEVSK